MAREIDCFYVTKSRTRRRRNLFVFIIFLVITVAIFRKLFLPKYSDNPKIENFMRDWCRVRKASVDWEGILRPCDGMTAWDTNAKGLRQDQRTDPDSSLISLWDIRPAGEFSKFSIQSKTAKGEVKRIGGDSWRVHLIGPSSVAGTSFDHTNGTYEVLFLVTVPGVYAVDVVLEYSLCDGYTDPPPNWFKTGNSQGKYQKEGILGSTKNRPFLFKKLWGGSPITITIPYPAPKQPSVLSAVMAHKDHLDLGCGFECDKLWDGFGNWVAIGNTMQWKPFVPGDDKTTNPNWFGDRVRKNSILWIYGDSVSEQFYSGIRQHPLCSRVFRWCGHTYNWVYRLNGNLTMAKSQDDDLDFDDVRVINELDDVISNSIFDKNSAILVNAGLHYLESSNFTNYKKVVDSIIRLFQRDKLTGGDHEVKVFPGEMIWKTTTSLYKDKLDSKHLQARRFLTSQRVLLFNAYATQAMCRAGFKVLDVFPLTDSYPHGTGKPERPKDAVHYQHFVFESVERLLEEFFITTHAQ
ncbi:uncharacterized protein LOC116296381 isoform X2 [Actinia tenebrosa]|uniref:Uncharacterized protein LOC116296381 isoform X2 n=1 Tax=Actinia tenebrosa TaxID=6105 RepID=A0A6P8HV08_ACTTE|nr:uncharacterized protein LOC116296381 isoform X2 [Actinia tenebrosa]